MRKRKAERTQPWSARTEWENVRADVGVGNKEGAITEEVVDPGPQFALNTGIEEFEH
jgi:hypothetical protein